MMWSETFFKILIMTWDRNMIITGITYRNFVEHLHLWTHHIIRFIIANGIKLQWSWENAPSCICMAWSKHRMIDSMVSDCAVAVFWCPYLGKVCQCCGATHPLQWRSWKYCPLCQQCHRFSELSFVKQVSRVKNWISIGLSVHVCL